MKNIVKLIDPDIIYNKFFGDQSPDDMRDLIGENQRIVRELIGQNIKPKYLGDISELKHLSIEARKMAIESFKRTTKYEKVAIIGANKIFKYLISFMSIGLFSIGNIKLFESEGEATNWLHKDA